MRYILLNLGKISEYFNRNRMISSVVLIVLLIATFAAVVSIITAPSSVYSGVTIACISCHNDTDYPNDTNADGRIAPFKRPHNDTVMCESCHLTNPHTVAFIQPNGNYSTRTSAASCPECHQSGIPANANFSTAPMIPNPMRHSSNVSNGTNWGNYWTNTTPKSACMFCHNNTLHNTTPFGRILEWSPNYNLFKPIGNNFSCSGCHYKGDPNWSQMNLSFVSGGLPTPPEITNGTSWNGITHKYYNHSFDVYDDQKCRSCHGSLLSTNANMSEFMHNVAEAAGEECIGCHTSKQGDYPPLNMTLFGSHRNVNKTDNGTITNADCMTCHYNFNYTQMLLPGFTTPTYICTDCHINGNFSAPVISNHKPPHQPVSPGGNISTTAYCSTCHNNSINNYAYSVNASVGHYGTNTTLIKPTVNQTVMPRFGFMTPGDASSYNKNCNYCHNPSNATWGGPTLITTSHTVLGTCNECHVNVNASDLHNGSLGIPDTFSCLACHTIYASKYRAPNLTGTNMSVSFFDCEGCHGGGTGSQALDSLTEHNINRNNVGFTPRGGFTDTVYLNNQTVLTISKGTQVIITSRVNDSRGVASRVGGAEYYIDIDPGIGKGVPMDAADGFYDAVYGAWENVTATIDTSNLSEGTYTIYVRGMDIGKQWSASQSATLTVQNVGYINGTVKNLFDWPVIGAIVTAGTGSTTTTDGGNYSLSVSPGTYNVTASKQPEYYDTTVPNVNVTALNTTNLYIVVTGKPTGTLSGAVTTG